MGHSARIHPELNDYFVFLITDEVNAIGCSSRFALGFAIQNNVDFVVGEEYCNWNAMAATAANFDAAAATGNGRRY